MPRMMFRHTAWPALLTAVVIGLAACGDDDSSTTTGSAAEADSKIAALVPATFKEKGTLTVAADATYAPNEFIGKDGKTVEGMDADLAKALGVVMGVKVKVVNVTFDSIIPRLSAGRYDLAMSSMTDNKEREKVVDFVTYYRSGTSFFTKKGSAVAPGSLAELCGTKVSVEKGTTQADDAAKADKDCKAAGKEPITVLVFPDQNAANLALTSGRAEVGMADTPVAAYQVELSKGALQLSGESYGVAPYGIAIAKDSGLENALLPAVKKLMADGTYETILKKWGVEAGAIDDPQLNGAIS